MDLPESGGAKGSEVVGRAGRPTLKTIAYMTGLGITTVSRALNDAPDIGRSTKERVRLVAQQIGYRPNRAGVRLRTGRTNVIGLILSAETEVLGLSSHLVYGISEVLAESAYHLIVTPHAPRRDPLDAVRYLVETGSADGLILSRTEPRDARVAYLHERGFPFATHGRTDMGIEHPFYDFDNERYASVAMEQLVARGRTRFTLLPPPPHLTCAAHMTLGFHRAIERHELIDIPARGISTDSSYEAMFAEITRLMGSRRRPDAFVCGSASSAIATISAAEAQGLVIASDFDVAVKEPFDLMSKFRRQIVVVREDYGAAGMALARAVIRTIAGAPPTELQTIELPLQIA